jgi:hypothetical protein
VETYFSKTCGTESVPDEITTNDSNDWDLLSQKYGNSLLQIDVRHLEMPQPMITILEALETLPSASALLVYHKRIPVFLLTELKERDFDFRIKKNSESEVNLLIFRK